MSYIVERLFELDWRKPPALLEQQLTSQLADTESAIRCCFSKTQSEVAVIQQALPLRTPFRFHQRNLENQTHFNVAFIVPTGVGAATGGHAGDATPILQAIAKVADHVITHPNVVNASDLNEMPDNAWYVEGSMLSALLMGTIGLVPRRQNRILVLIGQHSEQRYIDAAINAVNAARATYGLNCHSIEIVPINMSTSRSPSGRASGEIENIAEVIEIIEHHRRHIDAVAITSCINIEDNVRDTYLASQGEAVNPWGGVEAMLTHALSQTCNLPVTHAPMMPSQEVEELDYGVVDARVAAEMISYTYFQCVLKGLMRAPLPTTQRGDPKSFWAEDINAVIIPKGCLGIPVYAALYQSIPVIAVTDTMYSEDHSDLVQSLPWQKNQYREVATYSEAIGVLTCLKAGITPESISRPLSTMRATKKVPAIAVTKRQ